MTLTRARLPGFGLRPARPLLGEMLSQGKANIQAPFSACPASSARSPHACPAGFIGGKDRATPSTPRKTRLVRQMSEPLLFRERSSVAFRHGDKDILRFDRCRSNIRKGETLALVVEGGSGKSVTRAVGDERCCPNPPRPIPSGQILFKGLGPAAP